MPAAYGNMQVFDRRLVRARRNRRAGEFPQHDFLFREVADRLADRLDDVKRAFPVALDLGARNGLMVAALKGRGGVKTLIQAELAECLAWAANKRAPAVAADEEALPFADATFDLVLSCLSLHWVNDLPGALAQIRRTLKPDGLFLAALFGYGTLAELREAFLAAEAAKTGGAGPRVSPLADLRDAAGLLQRAGFAMPVADADTINVTYENAYALMGDLRGMGESNAATLRPRRPLARATLYHAGELYTRRFAQTDGRVRARFQVVYLTGWAPGQGQPRPLTPGSAAARLADALDAEERPAGEKTPSRRPRR